MIQEEMLRQMKEILREKGLDYVQFYIQFVGQILPDPQTGKKDRKSTRLNSSHS